MSGNPANAQINIPNVSPSTEKQHIDNWRKLNDWDQRVALTGRTLISKTVLKGAAASFTFANIPQNFNKLYLSMMAASDGAADNYNWQLQINGDTAAHYSYHIFGTVTGATPAAFVGNSVTAAVIGNTGGSNRTAIAEIEFIAYGANISTVRHALISNSGYFNLSDVAFSGGLAWTPAAPITSITTFPSGGNWIAGSQFLLYGEY